MSRKELPSIFSRGRKRFAFDCLGCVRRGSKWLQKVLRQHIKDHGEGLELAVSERLMFEIALVDFFKRAQKSPTPDLYILRAYKQYIRHAREEEVDAASAVVRSVEKENPGRPGVSGGGFGGLSAPDICERQQRRGEPATRLFPLRVPGGGKAPVQEEEREGG